MQRSLIIAAHPDDEVLGCGGLLARDASVSKQFRVLFIAEGSTCRYSDINSTQSLAAIEQRNQCALNALSYLNVNDVVFSNLPCGRLDQHPIIDINKIIEFHIRDFKPTSVYTHSPTDNNNDHRIVHRSTMMACRPLSTFDFLESIYSFEVLSSTEWSFETPFYPDTYVALDKYHVDAKIAALSKYTSELKPYPFPRSSEGIFSSSMKRGMEVGVKYAEAYSLIRQTV